MPHGHDHAIGGRALDRENTLRKLPQPQRLMQRQRMRRAALIGFGRDHPDIVREVGRNLLQDIEAGRFDAVVIRDENSHAGFVRYAIPFVTKTL